MMDSTTGKQHTYANIQARTCRYCGSARSIFKGWRKRKKTEKGHILYCKNCERYFTDKLKRKSVNVSGQKLLYEFMRQNKTVRELANKFSASKSTIQRKILEALERVPSWEGETQKLLQALRSQSFKNLVVDTTSIKVGGRRLTYLHAADNHLRLPLIYKLLPSPWERAELIKIELLKLKKLGYEPNVITIDGSMALLSAVKEVYGSTSIQLCIVHLERRLDEELKLDTDLPDQVLLDRERARNLIMHAACADEKTRKIMLEKLTELASSCLDKKVLKVIKDFMEKIEYYHTIEELRGHPEAFTTNLCENHIKQIKTDLRLRLSGFKSLATAGKYIDAYWKLKKAGETNENSARKKCLSFLLGGHIPLEKLAGLIDGVSYADLVDISTKYEKVIISTMKGHYPVSASQIKRIFTLASKVATIGQLADLMALDPLLVYHVIVRYHDKEKPNIKVKPACLNLKLDWGEKELDKVFRDAKIICQPTY